MKMKKILMVVFLLWTVFALQGHAQTGWGFQQYFIPAGSPSTGYPIVTAVVPEGSYFPVWGSTYQPDGNGGYNRVGTLTYVVPLSPDPLPQETHLFILGVCQSVKAPAGYRRIGIYRNIYVIDNPETGYDNTNEYCILEIAPK